MGVREILVRAQSDTHSLLILIPTPSQAIFWPKASDATSGISITIIATRNALKSGAKTHTETDLVQDSTQRTISSSLTPAADTPYSIKLNRRPGGGGLSSNRTSASQTDGNQKIVGVDSAVAAQ